MSVRDPDDFDSELMAMAQQHEAGDQDVIIRKLLDTEKEYLKEEEHHSTSLPTDETGESKIKELNDEKAEFQKELNMKSKGETSSTKTKEPVTKNNGEDYQGRQGEKDTGKLEPKACKGSDSSKYQMNVKMEESLEKGNRKNPMLLSPVIRNVFKFLNIKDLKSCRLVCREWGSTGKLVLASLAIVSFYKYETPMEVKKRLPVDFQSCFVESAAFFSAFKVFGYPIDKPARNSWTIEELTTFFEAQQKYIKELTLDFEYRGEKLAKKIDLGSWISKSPMVQKDAKHLTKLTIESQGNTLDIRPLNLIAHVKDLSLSNCRVHVEAGIKINSVKIKLDAATFCQDGIKLNRVRINDLVDLCKTKEVSLRSWDSTKYVLDLWGSITLEKLVLFGESIEIVNWGTSQWIMKHLAMTCIPYSSISMNSPMKVKELYLNSAEPIDLFALPASIENLALPNVNSLRKLRCSQQNVLPNLQYLQIIDSYTDFSFLSLFMNCSKLTHLKFFGCNNIKMKSLWMPKTIKTLTLENCDCGIRWLDETYWNLETLVVEDFRDAVVLCEIKIRVEDFIVNSNLYYDLEMSKSLTDFLEYRKRFKFGKRLYMGELKWNDKQFEDSGVKEHVDTKSSFYVFEDGQKGRSVPEKVFHEVIPKHLDVYEHRYG